MTNKHSLHLVSIIIPAYNRAEVLRDTLKSVLNQSYANWECLIVDDGSSDNTGAVVTEYALGDTRFKLLQRPAYMKKGANSCRNFGLKKAQGDFIKWLDSDDLLDPECLTKQMAAIADHDVCFCQADFFMADGSELTVIPNRVWGKLMPDKGKSVIESYLLTGVRWQTACGLWRRSFLNGQPFKEGLANSQEWLMHLAMLVKSPTIVYINENLCHIRSHLGSMSHSRNKRGMYYYHQCCSRIHALALLRKANLLNRPFFNKLCRFIFWNHLFVFYKGSVIKGFSFFSKYPTLLRNFLISRNSRH